MNARDRAAVLVLGVSQLVAWGILFYTFGVVLSPMSRELRASTAGVSATMSIAALISALAAVPLGRRFTQASISFWMSLGSVAAAGVLIGWSQVDSVIELYAVAVGLGVVQALTLYEPAFALVARWFLDESVRARALVTVTLCGGLASTVFVPLSTYLVERVGWRHTLLWLAAVMLLFPALLNGLLLRLAPNAAPAQPASACGSSLPVAPLARGPSLAGLGVLFFAVSLTTTALAVHLPTALTTMGHTPYWAALAIGWTGVAQLVGRLTLPRLTQIRSLRLALSISLAPLVIGFAGLSLAPPLLLLLLTLFALGSGAGVMTLMRPQTIGRLFPPEKFASASGTLALAHHAARAAGPVAAAWLYDRTGSYPLLFAGSAAALLLAAVSSIGPSPRELFEEHGAR